MSTDKTDWWANPRFGFAGRSMRDYKTPLWLRCLGLVTYANYLLIVICFYVGWERSGASDAKYFFFAGVFLFFAAIVWNPLIFQINARAMREWTDGQSPFLKTFPPTPHALPNVPPFSVRRSRFSRLRPENVVQALNQSGLTDFFLFIEHAGSQAVVLCRANGRKVNGETDWLLLRAFERVEETPGYVAAARFLESALHAGLLVAERAADGSPIVLVRLDSVGFAMDDVDQLPPWLAEPYKRGVSEQSREQETQARENELRRLEKQEQEQARQEEFRAKADARRASFRHIRDLVVAVLGSDTLSSRLTYVTAEVTCDWPGRKQEDAFTLRLCAKRQGKDVLLLSVDPLFHQIIVGSPDTDSSITQLLVSSSIANLQGLTARIDRATRNSGRERDSVSLLTTCDQFAPAALRAFHAMGQRHFAVTDLHDGEGGLADTALRRMDALTDLADIEWHLNRLVSKENIVKAAAERFTWVHRVHFRDVAVQLSAARPAAMSPLNLCVDVDLSGDWGRRDSVIEKAIEIGRVIQALPRLKLRGLTGVVDRSKEAPGQADQLHRLREVVEGFHVAGLPLDTLCIENKTTTNQLEFNSLDLDLAIAEGATMLATSYFVPCPAIEKTIKANRDEVQDLLVPILDCRVVKRDWADVHRAYYETERGPDNVENRLTLGFSTGDEDSQLKIVGFGIGNGPLQWWLDGRGLQIDSDQFSQIVWTFLRSLCERARLGVEVK